MLNEGSTAYPYQPYNGPVMHAIDVEGVKLWENGNPTSEIGATTLSIPNIYDYSRIKIAYKTTPTKGCSMFREVDVHIDGYFDISVSVAGSSHLYTREFQFVSGGLRVLQGYYNSVTSDTPIIPIAIYGIK